MPWLVVGVLMHAACTEVVERKVLHRGACEVCHQPLNEDGVAQGIADPHPTYPLACVTCHGGEERVCDAPIGGTLADPTCETGWIYDKDRSHVGPGDGPAYIKNLSGAKLDQVDRDYLRFINPGDFRVLDDACGRCHKSAAAAVTRSTMAHTSGEVTVARYRAGAQAEPRGLVGAIDLVDETFDEAEGACAVDQLERFDPPAVDLGATDATGPTVANAQDQYMVKSCFRCHLNDFGENRFPGDFRSSGCTACHMPYADDGLYQGTDPWVNRQNIPHPVSHQLTTSPPTEACTHCHYRGGRLGISFQGYRESSGAGLNPPRPSVLGRAIHGHDANYYLTDEDHANDWDETPPDVHFEAGMSCVDCHGAEDVHGDGHIYADTQCAVQTRCEDCHGSAREVATPHDDWDHVYERDGGLYLMTKVTGVELKIPQVLDAVTPGSPSYSELAEQSMGISDSAFSHSDEVQCYTCHSAWIPTCYGCHVEVDFTASKDYHTTGVPAPGRPTGRRRWVQLNDLVLIRDVEGKMAPSMPAERLFMTVKVPVPGGSRRLYESKPRTFTRPDGSKMAGFGQRAFQPHTVRRTSQFMACDRCHSVGDVAAPDNEVLLDLTHGFGTDRMIERGCDVTNEDESCDPETDVTDYRLDAVISRDGEPLVVIGHPDPLESRPLTLDEIARMRAVIVPEDATLSTEIPADAATNIAWPAATPFDDTRYPPTEGDGQP